MLLIPAKKTDEDPRTMLENKRKILSPPIDGAARVMDPLFDGINTGKHCVKSLKIIRFLVEKSLTSRRENQKNTNKTTITELDFVVVFLSSSHTLLFTALTKKKLLHEERPTKKRTSSSC
jgi:hypothetical protein